MTGVSIQLPRRMNGFYNSKPRNRHHLPTDVHHKVPRPKTVACGHYFGVALKVTEKGNPIIELNSHIILYIYPYHGNIFQVP